jgi:hypothetical protein
MLLIGEQKPTGRGQWTERGMRKLNSEAANTSSYSLFTLSNYCAIIKLPNLQIASSVRVKQRL